MPSDLKAASLLRSCNELAEFEKEAYRRHADMAVAHIEALAGTTTETFYSIPSGYITDIPGMDMYKCRDEIKHLLEEEGFFVRRLKNPQLLWISWDEKHVEAMEAARRPRAVSKPRRKDTSSPPIIYDPSNPLGGLQLRASLISHARRL